MTIGIITNSEYKELLATKKIKVVKKYANFNQQESALSKGGELSFYKVLFNDHIEYLSIA